MCAGEAECSVGSAEEIWRQVNLVQGGIGGNAFFTNGLDQYKAAVLGETHWIPVLCVLPIFKFEPTVLSQCSCLANAHERQYGGEGGRCSTGQEY